MKTIFVSPAGSDKGNGSREQPYATISYGVSKLFSSDTLIVLSGTYKGRENLINNVPSGTAQAYTKILAERPWAVRINSFDNLSFEQQMIGLPNSYVEVSGFICNIENTRYPQYVASLNGHFNKLTKCIFRRAGTIDAYGGWVEVNGSHNLVEDCAGVGAVRYGFKTGGTNSTASYNIFRRCVGRSDYSNSNQPKSTFAHYGNNDGWETHHIVFQNCISLDGLQPDYHGGTAGFKYGGLVSIKDSCNDLYQGNVILNEEAEYSGLWIEGKTIKLENNIIWGTHKGFYGTINPVGLWIREKTTDIQVINTTMGENTGGAIKAPKATKITGSLENPKGKKTLTKPDRGTTAGAIVMKKYGTSGSLFYQSGWDSLTTENLWPWYGEDVIKAVFSERNDPPLKSTPVKNDTKRGFCAAKGKFGQPQTLTKYVWEYLGYEIPKEIYG